MFGIFLEKRKEINLTESLAKYVNEWMNDGKMNLFRIFTSKKKIC